MNFNRWTLVACGAVLLAVAALGLAAHWNAREADRVASERAALQRTHSELESKLDEARIEAERAAAEAQEKTHELNDAIAKSKKYQGEQRIQSLRVVGLANGIMAASPFKPAVAEFFLSEGKWPGANQDIGMPPPESFKAKGVRSVRILPGGKIQIAVDDMGKKADVYLTASVNGAGQVTWTCMTTAIPDIARLVSTCVYRAH
jgi:Pilin (bacterial filament)